MIRRTLCAAVAIALLGTTAASASNCPPRHHRATVTLDAPEAALVMYDSSLCSDANGDALPCYSVAFTATNNSTKDATCSITADRGGVFADLMLLIDGVIPAGQQAAGSITTPYIEGANVLKLKLTCADARVVHGVRYVYLEPLSDPLAQPASGLAPTKVHAVKLTPVS
jgi:hypothetical protein